MDNIPKHSKTSRNRLLGFGTSADLAECCEDRGDIGKKCVSKQMLVGLRDVYNNQKTRHRVERKEGQVIACLKKKKA